MYVNPHSSLLVVGDHNHWTPAIIHDPCTLLIYKKHSCIYNTFLLFFVISATGQVTVTLPIDDDSLAMVKVKPARLLIPEESIQSDKIVSFEQLLGCVTRAGFDSQKVVTLYFCLPSV